MNFKIAWWPYKEKIKAEIESSNPNNNNNNIKERLLT